MHACGIESIAIKEGLLLSLQQQRFNLTHIMKRMSRGAHREASSEPTARYAACASAGPSRPARLSRGASPANKPAPPAPDCSRRCTSVSTRSSVSGTPGAALGAALSAADASCQGWFMFEGQLFAPISNMPCTDRRTAVEHVHDQWKWSGRRLRSNREGKPTGICTATWTKTHTHANGPKKHLGGAGSSSTAAMAARRAAASSDMSTCDSSEAEGALLRGSEAPSTLVPLDSSRAKRSRRPVWIGFSPAAPASAAGSGGEGVPCALGAAF